MIPTLLLSLLLSLLSPSSADDFCVADLSLPTTPAGYSCKKLSTVTADDFVYSGLRFPGNLTDPLFHFSVNPGSSSQIPGLNGLGISIARIDIAKDGAVPLHSHPDASEIYIVTRGTVIAGFISSNTVYSKSLFKGDVIVFPQGLLHFQVEAGHEPALGISAFSSSNPGLQFTSRSIFGNSLPSKLVEKVTLLDDGEVRKLKRVFGGSG
ncbi:germin-like protein 8-14 [Phalaenopsis equestris]|uniref:germin-like protein 8-14 n=1 Tax=Phalaenopsis equestris TaxID=78828 RepID=UPI0009E260DD|nr:germin-like protein 8-14 [Phalaenopsis equestris]